MGKATFCASAGPAAPTGASGAEGGSAADPAGGLLPDAVARDIQAVIRQTEEVAATWRAFQAFMRGYGSQLKCRCWTCIQEGEDDHQRALRAPLMIV